MSLRVLFAVAAWGLGHATRDLVLIRALLDAGHEVTILSTERALQLLRGELGNRCGYIDVPDIPKPLSRRAFWFYVRMSLSLPLVFWTFRHEHQVVHRLVNRHRFDRIVSDTRYGVYHREIPSFHIVHSLRQIVPGRNRWLELMVERSQQQLLSGGHKLLIPDQKENGLAGELCHNLAAFQESRLEYIGILSSVRKRRLEPDIDYFISVSGAEPQRSIFEEMVLQQIHDLPGRVVVALGRPDLPLSVTDDGRISVHSFMTRLQQEEMMNRARLVVSRSGYTTLMELAELGKRALLVPTVGQSEQEYLGAYHERLGTMHMVTQPQLSLRRDAEAAAGYSGIPLSHSTTETTRRFLALLEA
ncbi:MAG TPA: glycosyltransferase [Chloroflexota bacterium]|nr:glycosyltransferase [Chloroflexota bacterium]